jgi:hypothetical protein
MLVGTSGALEQLGITYAVATKELFNLAYCKTTAEEFMRD